MDYAFISKIESWGSGGQMLDVVTLDDGQILVMTEASIALYPDRDAFEAGTGAKVLSRDAPDSVEDRLTRAGRLTK